MLDLLRIRNGGGVAPGRRTYPTGEPTSWAEDHVPVEDLMGIGHADGAGSLLDTPYLIESFVEGLRP